MSQAIETYLDNKESLLENSLGKYAVIHRDAILMVFEEHQEAVDFLRTTKMQEAIIKRVVNKEPILQVLHRGSVVEFSPKGLASQETHSGDGEPSGADKGSSCRESTAENPKIASFS